jgi:prolyl oligopeptidase
LYLSLLVNNPTINLRMLRQFSICLLLLLVPTSFGNKIQQYPEVRRDLSVVDDYYGTQVPDPYRYLEDSKSEEVKKFVQAQNSITHDYLNGVSSHDDESASSQTIRDDILKALTQAYRYPKYSLPQKVGPRYSFLKNTGLQNQRCSIIQF